MAKTVDETSPKEEKKGKATVKAKMIKISKETYQKIAAAPYEVTGIFLGDHWKLDKREMTMAGEALKDLMEAMGPEWLYKYFPLLGFALVNLELIAQRAKTHKELKDEKEEADKKAQEAVKDALRAPPKKTPPKKKSPKNKTK